MISAESVVVGGRGVGERALLNRSIKSVRFTSMVKLQSIGLINQRLLDQVPLKVSLYIVTGIFERILIIFVTSQETE